jgi:hypothetical protein
MIISLRTQVTEKPIGCVLTNFFDRLNKLFLRLFINHRFGNFPPLHVIIGHQRLVKAETERTSGEIDFIKVKVLCPVYGSSGINICSELRYRLVY